MNIRITIEVEDLGIGRRPQRWIERSQTKYEMDPNTVGPSLDRAIEYAGIEFGFSSNEARFLRDLKHQLTK